MALLLKVDPVGIDRPIDKIQQALYTGLVTNGTWTMYESYHRAYKNETKDGIVPEIFTGKKDYKDAFTDDGFTATSFFLIPDEVGVVEGQKFQAEISIIFQVDLAKLYPNAPDSRRFDEEMHNEILNILNDLDANFTDVDYVTSLDSVYAGLDTSKIKWNDLQPYHVVRFTVTANYDYQCNPVFAKAGLVCTIGVDMTKTDPTTIGGNDGTATATPTGNQGAITYQWDDPLNQTTQTATGLTEGTYSCIVTDNIILNPACNTMDNIELEDPAPICTVSVVVVVTPETIQGADDGTATATPSGGQGVLTYAWTGPNSFTSTDQNLTALEPGLYTVIVSDDIIIAPPCTATDNGTVDAATTDADALAFINAASITELVQQEAINELVIDLKDASLWDKVYYMYPFVGGTASQHSYNLKDPSLFQITWFGGIVHSATGVLGNATNGYGLTGFNPNTVGVALNSFGLGFYSRTDNITPSWCDVGGIVSGVRCMIQILIGNIFTGFNTTSSVSSSMANSDKLIFSNRTASNMTKGYRDAVEIHSDTTTSTTVFNANIPVLALDSGGTIIRYSGRENSMSFAIEGLTPIEVTAITAIVETYQVSLSRNV